MRRLDIPLFQRIRAGCPFHVIRDIVGQPRPDKLDKTWQPFARVVEGPHVNRWCFASKRQQQEFINVFGGRPDVEKV